jgi:hypothetical protein
MATSDNVNVYDLPPSPPKWDRVGIFFVSFCGTWSSLVFAGMVFCWLNRRSPILRIRGLPLSFSAILLLHTYWILAQLMYPVGRTLPIVVTYDIQYFFMGIWLPLGIALLHASNSRLICIAKLQRQFASQPLVRVTCNGGDSSVLCRFRSLECTAKLMMLISAGMILQVCFLSLADWGP